MAPWLTPERRENPGDEDYKALLLHNVHQMSEHIEQNRVNIQESKIQLAALDSKLDEIKKHSVEHEKASAELLANFRFQKRLRRWFVGLLTGATLLFTFWLETQHFFEHIAVFFKGKS